ncbi:MAG: 2'-5' RNA ligase family protein [Candidatus Thorarchaeota archaeon]
MDKVYTTAIVIIPPKEIWEPIQKIRKQYDRQIKRWMPHINLIYPFRPIYDFDNLEPQFNVICQQIPPFEISLKSFNYFTHGHQNFTIWLRPDPMAPIIKLQERILKLVPDCNDLNLYRNGFTPHLSIGQIKGKKVLIETINNLESNWIPQNFLLDRIFFIAREDRKNSTFQEKKIIKFS